MMVPDFIPNDFKIVWCLNTETDARPVDFENGQSDFVTDHDLLSFATREHKHPASPPIGIPFPIKRCVYFTTAIALSMPATSSVSITIV